MLCLGVGPLVVMTFVHRRRELRSASGAALVLAAALFFASTGVGALRRVAGDGAAQRSETRDVDAPR